MSLVVAIKKDGVVYLGADTRTSCGDEILSRLLPEQYKIHRLGDCYVGAAGRVAPIQPMLCHPEWFLLGGEPLTKRHLVREIVPKYYSLLRRMGFLEEPTDADDSADSKCVFLITDGKRIFRITDTMAVVEEPEYAAIGCTQNIAAACCPTAFSEAEPRDKLLSALRISAYRNDGVGAPFVLVNTRDNNFEIVED